MSKIDWNLFKKQITNLYIADSSRTGKDIAEIVKLSHPEINFPVGADRRVNEIIANYKEAVGDPSDNQGAKILVYDIETHPMIAYVFSLWQKGISEKMIHKDVGMLSWSAKWLFEDEIMSDHLNEKELKTLDYRRITKSLWDLIDEADILIAHNGLKFDMRMMNTFFLKTNLPIPSPYLMIDTLAATRKAFKLTSYKLDFIANNVLELTGKLPITPGLWKSCMENNYEAMLTMDEYCRRDVTVLEDVYMAIRAWIRPHPNAALTAVTEEDCCPVCASAERTNTQTTYKTYVNEYQAHRCNSCGHIYRNRKSLTPIWSHPTINVSIPK